MGATPPADNVLTDRLLRSWLRCRRKAWLDCHGDPADRRWTAHRTLQLNDQQRSFMALMPRKPGHGELSCVRGCDGVVGLRLKGTGPAGERLEAHPPLLQRVKGRSRWGAYAYQPVLARQGRRLTREHQLPLALMGLLLEQHQQCSVPGMLVLGWDGSRLVRERVGFSRGLRRQLADALRKLSTDLSREQPPSLAADRRKCSLCCWRDACDAVAAAEGHLSEVSGIGGKRREILLELGIRGLSDLAAADPQHLAAQMKRFGEQHMQVAQDLVAQARAQRDGVAERLDASASLPELDEAPGVLLYDIESDPDARHDFLHGFLCMRRGPEGGWNPLAAKYQPLLALTADEESPCWDRLKRLLSRYEEWPVLHYGETEIQSLKRLAERQGEPESVFEGMSHRLVDVHARVRSHWRLPLRSYGLKTVAGWQGFHWSRPGVDGARALLWWRQWRGDGPVRRGSRHGLRWIFDYNRDDCLATWAVAEWLLLQDEGMHGDQQGGS